MSDEDYVSYDSWLAPAGRPDAIDEIADQVERRPYTGADAFWSSLDERRGAPIRAAADSFVPRAIERRAG